mgnify:CR=1 FL=1
MVFDDSTPFFSKHQNKAENQDLDDSEVLISHWSYWPLQPQWPQQPLKPYFIKKLPDPDDWIIPGTKMTNAGPFLWNVTSVSKKPGQTTIVIQYYSLSRIL